VAPHDGHPNPAESHAAPPIDKYMCMQTLSIRTKTSLKLVTRIDGVH
jgi:hypothetical protein